MTRGTIRDLIRKRLGETTSAFWTDTELNIRINAAFRDIAERTLCIRTSSYLTTVSGTQEYSLSSNLPGLIDITKVYYYKAGATWDELDETNYEELDIESPGWKSASSGTPDRYYWDRDEDIIGFYVKPDSTNAGSNYAQIYYAKEHTDISTDSSGDDSSPTITEPLHEAAVFYTVATGFAERGWGDKENDMWQKYFQRIHDHQALHNPGVIQMRNYRR